MSQDTYRSGGKATKLSYRQLQKHKQQMRQSFAVADKLAPKIRAHEQKESQQADEEIETFLSSLS